MKPRRLTVALVTVGLLVAACGRGANPQDRSPAGGGGKPAVTRAPFGQLPDGAAVDVFTLTNAGGMEVRTIPYGAIIVSIKVPDRNGRLEDVVLGFDTLDGYASHRTFFGAVVGRYGNRIAKGRFTLDGKTYQLATNNGPNHLHGGVNGFDKLLWKAQSFDRDGNTGVAYTLTSRAGDEGYPGTLDVRVTYTLTPANELMVEYEATTDQATPINLTQHSFFNLAGDWVLNRTRAGLVPAAHLEHPATGRTLDVSTTEPGMQFYSGNFLDGTVTGKSEHVYKQRYGLCLEPQHFPDSPNKPSFPTTELKPGQTFHSTTVYRFR